MTGEQQRMIAKLRRCTFAPGSYDKRFVMDMASCPADFELSARQDWYLRRTYWRYRRQIKHRDPKPADYDNPPAKPCTLSEAAREIRSGMGQYLKPSAEERRKARELKRLEAWNEGKAKV